MILRKDRYCSNREFPLNNEVITFTTPRFHTTKTLEHVCLFKKLSAEDNTSGRLILEQMEQ